MCSHTLSCIDGSVTSKDCLLWHMHIYTSVLPMLKGHEPLPGMVCSIYAGWDTLLSLLLCTLGSSVAVIVVDCIVYAFIQVAGKVKLKSDDKLRRLSVSLKADIETQYMPRQSRNVTYISRLQVKILIITIRAVVSLMHSIPQSVQSAIDGQLTSLVKSHPSQRVALVSFSDEVGL